MLRWQFAAVFGIPLCLAHAACSEIETHEAHPESCSESEVALQDHIALVHMTMHTFQRRDDEAHAPTKHAQPRHGPNKSADHRPPKFDSLAFLEHFRKAMTPAVKKENHHAGPANGAGTNHWLFIGFVLLGVVAGLAIVCIPGMQDPEASSASIDVQSISQKRGAVLSKAIATRAKSVMSLIDYNPSFRIPMSSYGTAMILPILLEQSSWMEWLQTDGKCYMRLAINYLIQIPMAYGMSVIAQTEGALIKSGDCDVTNLPLVYAGLFLFVCTVIKDMEETIDITDIAWNLIPTTEQSRTLLYVEDDDEFDLTDGGFSWWHKMGITAFIIVPKFIISVVVLAYGSLFLASSVSNQDVLLNVLALVFIMEIDEMIFTFFAPRRLIAAMEALPEFQYDGDDGFMKKLRTWGLQMKIVFCFVGVGLFYCLTPTCGLDSWIVDVEDNPKGALKRYWHR